MAIQHSQIKGIRAVGVPVRDRTGRVLGSVSVSGPVGRLQEDRFRETLPEKVRNTTKLIESNVNMNRIMDTSGAE